MAEKIEREVSVGGHPFHTAQEGAGFPVLLIMGLGAPGDKWAPTVAGLRDDFRCITFDNRGAGRSWKPEQPAYSTDEMAEDAVGVLDALGIARAAVIGTSMGGAIAQKLALAHPERVQALVLTSTYASVSFTFRRAIETLSDAIDKLDRVTFKHLNQWMSFSHTFQNAHPEALAAAEAEDFAYPYPMPVYAFRAQCAACLAHDTAARLGELAMPTLVAAGGEDLYMTAEKTREMTDGIPNSRLYLCGHGGHVHQWEQAEAYNRAVRAFLNEHCPAR